MQKIYAKLGLKLAVKKIENEWCSGSFCYAEENFQKNLNDKHCDQSYNRERKQLAVANKEGCGAAKLRNMR